MSIKANSTGGLSITKSTAMNDPWTKLFWAYVEPGGQGGAIMSDDDGTQYYQTFANYSVLYGEIIRFVYPAVSGPVVNVPFSTWQCFVVVCDGVDVSVWTAAFGGTLTSVVTDPCPTATSSTVHYLTSGANEWASTLWSLGPAREWDVALTSGEIAAEMNRLTPSKTSDLVYSYYNRTVSEAGVDFSGNSNNASVLGTLANGFTEPAWYDVIVQQDSDFFTGFSPGFNHPLSLASGSNRFLLAILKRVGSGVQNFTSVQYNGTTMNLGPTATSVAFSNRSNSAMFWLPDSSLPSSTGTYNLSWSFTGAGSLYGWEAIVLVYSGAYQSQIGATSSQFSDSNTTTTYSTNIDTIGNNSLVVDCLVVNDSNSAGTPGSGQTELNDSLSSGGRFMVSSKFLATPQTSPMSWVFGSGTSQSQAIIEILDDGYSPTSLELNSIFFGFSF